MGEDAMTSRICGECGQLTAFYDTCSCVRQQLANAEARVRVPDVRAIGPGSGGLGYNDGWNACRAEMLARLGGEEK